jgi:hypothetical protein
MSEYYFDPEIWLHDIDDEAETEECEGDYAY